jgi:hypothetical protein
VKCPLGYWCGKKEKEKKKRKKESGATDLKGLG